MLLKNGSVAFQQPNATKTTALRWYSVTVTCLADGFPLAHYLKLSKDQQVFVEYQNSSTSGIVNDHDVTFMKTITTLKLADNGNYKCEAINQVEGTDYKRESETSLKICK